MMTIPLSDIQVSLAAILRVNRLRSQELCVFYANSVHQICQNLDVLKHGILRSKKVVLTIPESVMGELETNEILDALHGIYAFSVKFALTEGLNPKHAGRNLTGDALVVSRFQALVKKWSGRFRIIPEIELGEELTLLGPTLMELSQTNPPWCVLAVDQPPDETKIRNLQNCFEYLQIRNFPHIDIHFSFIHPDRMKWKLQSSCFLSGPEYVHIDLSNKCTHSCKFCALYAPDALEEQKQLSDGKFNPTFLKFISAQLPFEKAAEIIESLPDSVEVIQFGGAGDPMTHPNAIEVIALARERAFAVEVLSNMEYFKEGDLEQLTALGGISPGDLCFVANVSAATPETYVLTRPRQTEKTFHKVMDNLKKLTALRKRNGNSGAQFTLMCVLNQINFHEAPLFVKLASEIGARNVWLKPLEVHHHLHYGLLPPKEKQSIYRQTLGEALRLADELGMPIVDRQMMDSIAGV